MPQVTTKKEGISLFFYKQEREKSFILGIYLALIAGEKPFAHQRTMFLPLSYMATEK
jgi:hypothetical protein